MAATTENTAVVGYDEAAPFEAPAGDAKDGDDAPLAAAPGCKLFSVRFPVPCFGDVITRIQTTFPVHRAFFVFGATEVPISVHHLVHSGKRIGAVLWHGAPFFRNATRAALRVLCDVPEDAALPSRSATRVVFVYDIWPPALAHAFAAYSGPLVVGAPSVSATLIYTAGKNEFFPTRAGPRGGAVRWWETLVLEHAKRHAGTEAAAPPAAPPPAKDAAPREPPAAKPGDAETAEVGAAEAAA